MDRREYFPDCSAPIHEDSCDGVGDTMDHLTPRSIAKKLGWSKAQVNAPDNMQPLSQVCHTAKDSTTPLRLELLRIEAKGVIFTFEQHNAIFNGKEVIDRVA